MSVIDAAIRRIKMTIPRQVLNEIFLNGNNGTANSIFLGGVASTIEEEISDKIIREFVVPDISRYGPTVDIPISGLPFRSSNGFTRVYDIPPALRDGRDIVAATYMANVTTPNGYGYPSTATRYSMGSSGVLNNIGKMVRQNNAVPMTMTPDVKRLSGSAVEVRDPNNFTANFTVRCRLAYSDNLTEIAPAYEEPFVKLIQYATQTYIYNQLIIKMDSAQLENGMELGAFKSAVERFEGSMELYEEQLKVCAQCSSLNDDMESREIYRNSGAPK